MARAVLDGETIAESDDVRVVEGMTYFPIKSIRMEFLAESKTTSQCFWKGKAHYWDVSNSDGLLAIDAAFGYPKPWPLAKAKVKDRIAFWNGVDIVTD